MYNINLKYVQTDTYQCQVFIHVIWTTNSTYLFVLIIIIDKIKSNDISFEELVWILYKNDVDAY